MTDWKRLHNETPEGSGVNKMGDPITDDLQVTFNEFELWWKESKRPHPAFLPQRDP